MMFLHNGVGFSFNKGKGNSMVIFGGLERLDKLINWVMILVMERIKPMNQRTGVIICDYVIV